MITSNKSFVEARYASWLKQAIDFTSPKNLFLIAGRGTAKTSDILADRSIDIVYDMPRAMFALVSNTYVNNLTNIVPTLLEGWRERKGWIEGVHYVTDRRPPSHFALTYKPVVSYKHTISTHNGCLFNLGSLDEVSSLAGNSYQHIFGDESKYLDQKKLKKLMPARRGFREVSNSIYYRGLTFTTDMPNVTEGDHDWILDREKNMDLEQIKLAMQVGSVLNEIRHEYYQATEKGQKDKLKQIQAKYTRWYTKWAKLRKNSTFFYVVSSFANADILQPGYYKDVLESDGIEEFKASIMSLKPTIKKGEKFYVNLADHHFFSDGVDNSYYDKFKLGDEIKQTSYALKYLNPRKAIDCGVDFGNMTCMVVGQDSGNFYNILKNLHVLGGNTSKQLAEQFCDFFSAHRHKVLNMYYDRAGNQYKSIKRDWASEIADHIKTIDSAWRVNLMSREQSTIYQEEEYQFQKKFMGGYYDRLPILRIDELQCRELTSSLKLTKVIVKRDKTGSVRIHKDKSSEKLPLLKLPMYSTNYSDAFKYLMYRKKWVDISKLKSSREWEDPIAI